MWKYCLSVPWKGKKHGRDYSHTRQDRCKVLKKVVKRLSTSATMVIAIRKARSNLLPLDITEFVAVHGWPPFGNLPSRELRVRIL